VNAATGTEMSTDRRIGRGWVAFTTIAMWAIFLQSVTAGRILSGDDWARTTHRTTAVLLFLVILAGGLAALAVLRERTGGRRMAIVLVALAVCLFVQHRLGAAAADGEDTLWLHIPFGVAIFAFAAQANMLARRLEPAPEADLTVGAHDIDLDSDEYRLAPGEQRVACLQVDAGPHPFRGLPSPRPAAVRGRVVMTRPVPPTKEHQP
jgi:hypothetical protein